MLADRLVYPSIVFQFNTSECDHHPPSPEKVVLGEQRFETFVPSQVSPDAPRTSQDALPASLDLHRLRKRMSLTVSCGAGPIDASS